MSNPFEAYAHKALSKTPDRLIGPISTRAAARLRYAEIVAELGDCEDADQLVGYLLSIRHETAQFAAELQFFWQGDGDDFIGLSNEIEAAKVRCDGWPTCGYQEKENWK